LLNTPNFYNNDWAQFLLRYSLHLKLIDIFLFHNKFLNNNYLKNIYVI
jgi:hypothetical protein